MYYYMIDNMNSTKDEFDNFCKDADIRLTGEMYNIALRLYNDLDNYNNYDDAMQRVDNFNKFIDENNNF